MGSGNSGILMEICSRAISRMRKQTGMGFIFTRTGLGMKAIGRTIFRMGKDSRILRTEAVMRVIMSEAKCMGQEL